MVINPIKFRLQVFLIIFVVILCVGTFGFMLTEHLTLSDALYFSIVTISTVGYGDVHPTSPLSKAIAVFLIIMGVGTFLGAIGNATELMLYNREKKSRLEKLNIVIGVFFSEVGTQLLTIFSAADDNLNKIRDEFLIKKDSADEHFLALTEHLARYKSHIAVEKIDLLVLTELLMSRKDFLLRLLENQNLLENESFTGILWAVLHLAQELSFREDFAGLPDTDRAHLGGDVKRVYDLLIRQWVEYMYHLKEKYPYLFSLSIRTNPFDKKASVVVT